MEETITPPPPPPPPIILGWRHVQCLLLFFGTTIGYALRGCMSVAIVAMRNSTANHSTFPQYDWDQSTSTIILGSFFWGYVLTQIPAGHFARTKSALKILSAGIFTSSLLNMLIPFIAKFGPVGVICTRVAMGFFSGCLLPCTYTLMSRWIPPSERSRLGSFIINGVPLGTIFSMSVSGFLVGSRFGWPSVYYFFSSLGIVWSILFYLFSTDYPSDHPRISLKEIEYIDSNLKSYNRSENKEVTMPWKAILTSVPLWAANIANCGNTWGYYTFFTQLPTYMKYALNYDISESGMISALPYISMWLMGFPISFLSDYAQNRGASIGCLRKVVATIGFLIPAIALLLLAIITSTDKTTVVSILVVALGFNAATTGSMMVNHIDLAPNFAGPVTSYLNAVANFVSLGLPYLCNLIITDETNIKQWRTIFFVTSGVYFLSNLVFVIFAKGDVQSWNDPRDDALKSSYKTVCCKNRPRTVEKYESSDQSDQD